MTYQHKSLAKGRWAKMPFLLQLANIGSEISRTVNWKKKKNKALSESAFFRALELLELTLDAQRKFPNRLREIARAKEAIIDRLMKYG